MKNRWIVALSSCVLVSSVAVQSFAQEPAPPAPPEPPEEAPLPKVESLEAKLAALMGRPGGLTAREVGRRAALNSLDARAKQAELAAASADVDRAVIGYLPRLTLSARYTHLSPVDAQSFGPKGVNLVATPAGPGPLPPGAPLVGVPASSLSFPVITDQYALQAALVVPVSDYVLRIAQTHTAASHARKAAELTARAAKLDAAADAKMVYYTWVRARLQQEVARQNLTQAKSHYEAAKAIQDVDRVSKADVLRSESAVAAAELLVERAENLTKLSEDRLKTLLKEPDPVKYEIGEDLVAPLPANGEPVEFSKSYKEALRRRLELRALDVTRDFIAEQRRAVKGSGYPRLDAFGNAYYANPNQRYVPQQKEWKATWDVGLQVSWTPNDMAISRATSSALEAQRLKLAAQKEQLADALRTEVFDAVQSVREAEVSIGTSERGLKAAEEAYRVRTEQFRFGRASSVELSDSEADLLRSRLELVNARVALRVARVKLDHALGRDSQ